MSFEKVTRRQAKLRMALTGVSGSGKTLGALYIAYGITGDWDKMVLRRILCKRYSTNVKNGAVFCACAGLNSLGYRSPVQALQYARPQGVNAARACREAYSLGIR